MESWPDLPKRVKGVLFKYKVIEVDSFDDADQYGITDVDKGTIKILQSLEPSLKWQTFFHELIHVCEQEVGMRELKDDKGDSDADRLGLALISIWQRNKWILPGDTHE